MHVCVIYFGLARRPDLATASLTQHLFASNSGQDIAFTTIASLNLVDKVFSPRAGEHGVPVRTEEVFDLAAGHYLLTKQDRAVVARNLAFAQRQADPFVNDWNSVTNLLFQLRSLRTAWVYATEDLAMPFDYYLFIRPDLQYLDDFPLAQMAVAFAASGRDGNIAIPEWHNHFGYNDRFAFADAKAAEVHANRLVRVQRFTESKPLHSESFLKFALDDAACEIWGLPVRARRIRATGEILDENFQVAVSAHRKAV